MLPNRSDFFTLINHFNGLYASIQLQAAEDSEPGVGDLSLRGADQRAKIVTSKRAERISGGIGSASLDPTNEVSPGYFSCTGPRV